MYNKGFKYLERGIADKAIQCFKKFHVQHGETKESLLNMGNAYRLLNRHNDALKCYIRANSTDVKSLFTGKFGEYDLACNNAGLQNYTFGRDNEAIEWYKRALALNPQHYDATWNYASALLRKWCSGTSVDLEFAWGLYDTRFIKANPVKLDRFLPKWDGTSRVGKICVLAEQGMGDKIMFGRYLDKLASYCDEVWVQIPSELDCMFSGYRICRDSSECVGGYGIPFCDLAKIFGLVDGEWLADKFGPRDLDTWKVKIGVLHTGSPTHANDRNRSIPAGYLRDLTHFGDVYHLGFPGRAIAGITETNPTSWSDTIAQILKMDVVVTVDSAIVHVCGSLGVPCLMMQPLIETDFRWGTRDEKIANGLDPEWNRWYASVRVITNPGSWEIALARVMEILRNEYGWEYKSNKAAGVILESAKND